VPQRDSGEPYEGDLHRRARWRYPAFRSEMLYGCTCQKGSADNSTQRFCYSRRACTSTWKRLDNIPSGAHKKLRGIFCRVRKNSS
jgi:hypothetical protein